MSTNISPGVYVKVTDLSTYVQVVPGTIGFMCGLTEKGRDNDLQFVSVRSDLISEWGKPNINKYGVNYGQGLYCAYNFLGESSSLYFLRCLPDDATYSNLRLDCQLASTDTSASISISYVDSVNNSADITTALTTAGQTKRLCIFYPIGRGEYYNNIGIRITATSDPLLFDTYVLDIYEKQSDGTDVIIESFTISFNETETDSSGSSIYIEDVLNTYSSIFRCSVGADGYDLIAKVFDKDVGTTSIVLTSGSATITDNKQDFSDWEDSDEIGNATYLVTAKDGKGNQIWGWLGAASGNDDDTVNVFNYRQIDSTASDARQSWNGDTDVFDVDSTITYIIKKSYVDISETFSSTTPAPLKKGSEGSLIDSSGSLVTAVATQILANGYAGVIDTDVLDTDSYYFNLVFDCGYPSDVKTQIVTLCQTREDCNSIIDNSDNATYTASITSRQYTHTFNTFYTAIYEPYNKVYDQWTGKDIWVSPVYHMSYLLPRNDRVSESWFATAGYNRGSISDIKELRFNPRLGQRDQMYLNQLNPIVKFSSGTLVWGQLTSQAKASAMQDLNVSRLYLYCRKALSNYCINFIFEQNDEITWSSVRNDITDFLEGIKRRRGLDSFNVEVSATEYEKKIKTFHANIELFPTKVVEKIELNFFIK